MTPGTPCMMKLSLFLKKTYCENSNEQMRKGSNSPCFYCVTGSAKNANFHFFGATLHLVL